MSNKSVDSEDWIGKDIPLGDIWSESPDDLESARKFLHFEISDASTIEEVIDNITFPLNYSMSANFDISVKNLRNIEWLANESSQNVSLKNIVLWDANHIVKSDEEARLWILELAELIRDILRDALRKQLAELFQGDDDEDMPPRKYPVIVSRPRKYFFPE